MGLSCSVFEVWPPNRQRTSDRRRQPSHIWLLRRASKNRWLSQYLKNMLTIGTYKLYFVCLINDDFLKVVSANECTYSTDTCWFFEVMRKNCVGNLVRFIFANPVLGPTHIPVMYRPRVRARPLLCTAASQDEGMRLCKLWLWCLYAWKTWWFNNSTRSCWVGIEYCLHGSVL